MRKISIKTGTETRAGTDATATMKICDSLNNCCQTGDLDNDGNDRRKGQTDVYENSLLSVCRQVTFRNKVEIESDFQTSWLMVRLHLFVSGST